MFYKKFNVNEVYSNFIECVYIWEGKVKEDYTLESPPSAYTSIVFNYKDPYFVSNLKYQKHIVPSSFIAGQATRNYKLHISGNIGMIGIVFKPTGIYNYLSLNMKDLNDERIDFTIYEPELNASVLDGLMNSNTVENKLDVALEFIDSLQQKGGKATDAITMAGNKIIENMGVVDLALLINESFMSRRSFERKFLTEVGVSPKLYAKIRRYGYVCAMIAGKREVNFTDILFNAGYYDQSHFIKDFKYFAGRAPQLYSKTNNELAHLLKGTYKNPL